MGEAVMLVELEHAEEAQSANYEHEKAKLEAELGFEADPEAMSSYALCIAVVDADLKLARGVCFRALAMDPNNPEIILNLAKLFLIGKEKKIAISIIHKGLALSPEHADLRVLGLSLGLRRKQAVGFLPRKNFINKALGRLASYLEEDEMKIVIPIVRPRTQDNDIAAGF